MALDVEALLRSADQQLRSDNGSLGESTDARGELSQESSLSESSSSVDTSKVCVGREDPPLPP